MSQYIVSARKYRPDSFESLIGQDNIAKTLKNSILRGQLAHAYLFCGPRGVGKTSAARIFAKTINCENPSADMEPCGQCESCESFQEGRSYCIHELDAASNNGVDDIKALMDQVQIPPQVGKYSVYIIDEVHMLTQSAFNAFLKTLEEPPAHAIFILCTTEKHKIIPTILSRCQTYDFNRISISDIVRNLRGIAQKESITIDDESLHVIAHKADGAMRDALTIFDQTIAFCGTQVGYEDVIRNLNVLDYEYSFRLVDSFLKGDYSTGLLIFDEVLKKGFNALHFINALGDHLRDLLVSRTGGLEALLDLPESLGARYKEQGGQCNVQWLYDALGIVTQCEAGYRASSNQRLHIEFSLMKLAFLNRKADASVPTAQNAAPSAAPAAARSAQSQIIEPKAESYAAPSAVESTPVQDLESKADVPVSGDAVAALEPAVPVEDKPKVSAPKPETSKTAPKTGASLSLSAMMSGAHKENSEKEEEKQAVVSAPSQDRLKEIWDSIVAGTQQPRLAAALSKAKLEFSEDEGNIALSFSVLNESQKKWMEEKVLRDIEARLREESSYGKINVSVYVLPEEQVEKKKYMPSEKAQDLIQNNSEIKDLVIDLGLDVL